MMADADNPIIRGPEWSNATVKRTSTKVKPLSRSELNKIYHDNNVDISFQRRTGYSLSRVLAEFGKHFSFRTNEDEKEERKIKMEEATRTQCIKNMVKGSKMVLNSADFRKFKDELKSTGYQTNAGTKQIIYRSMDNHEEIFQDHQRSIGNKCLDKARPFSHEPDEPRPKLLKAPAA